MGEHEQDRFVFDLADHAWSKCRTAIYDAMALLDDPVDKARIAMLVVGRAAGAAGGAFSAAHGGGNSKEARREWTLAVIDLSREVVSDGHEAVVARKMSEKRP